MGLVFSFFFSLLCNHILKAHRCSKVFLDGVPSSLRKKCTLESRKTASGRTRGTGSALEFSRPQKCTDFLIENVGTSSFI